MYDRLTKSSLKSRWLGGNLIIYPSTHPGLELHVDQSSGSDTYSGLDWDHPLATIQAAVDKCGDGVGDIIYVAPGKYTENVLIVDHASIKIIAPFEGWETRLRPSDAVTKYPLTPVGGTACPGCGFNVLSRGVEIYGFILDTGGGYGGIYIGDGYRINASYDENPASTHIHGCYLRGGGEGLYGIILDGCSDDILIENNQFRLLTLESILIVPGGSRTVQNPVIRRNEFQQTASGKYAIDTYNDNTTVGIVVRENFFSDKTGINAFSCRFQGTGVHHFVGNYDCSNGGAVGSATDFMCGNFEAHAMNVPVYVAEA